MPTQNYKQALRERRMNHETDWRHVLLGNILDDNTIKAITKVLYDCNQDKVDLLDSVCINRIKIILEPLKRVLLDKGYDYAFLAYTIAFTAKRVNVVCKEEKAKLRKGAINESKKCR